MLKTFKKQVGPFVLIILDGWGIAPSSKGNAIALAKTPNMDRFLRECPHALLEASGENVGLPKDQVGNSEAGHLNLGAGRIVKQDVLRINDAIKDGTFFRNSAFVQAVEYAKKNRSNLHLLGILSNENSTHSHPKHLRALLEFTRKKQVKAVNLHLFTDGRDTPPYSSLRFLKELKKFLKPKEKILTIAGRYYLDRKKDWQKTEIIYNTLILGEGLRARTAEEAIKAGHERGETDEFIVPTLITKDHKPTQRIADKDAIIFFHFRSDRARQLAKAFVQKKFDALNPDAFRRKKVLKDHLFVALTDYGPELNGILTAFPSPDVKNPLLWVLKDLRKVCVGESEKFAHVTYFFNGGYSDPVAGEQRVRIDSPQVSDYKEKPEMSAENIKSKVIKFIRKGLYDFIVVNFANADMVAHTGNLISTIKGCEVVDKCVGEIVEAVVKKNGQTVITADHGNAEVMIDQDGDVDTGHNSSLVPFIIYCRSPKKSHIILSKKGVLADVAPTILELMGRQIPKEMTGRSLIVSSKLKIKVRDNIK